MTSSRWQKGVAQEIKEKIGLVIKQFKLVVKFILKIDARITVLVAYFYWASVGLVYEDTYYKQYGISIFDFTVIEDIAFMTAKTWFLFLFPLVAPPLAFVVGAFCMVVVSILLVVLGRRRITRSHYLATEPAPALAWHSATAVPADQARSGSDDSEIGPGTGRRAPGRWYTVLEAAKKSFLVASHLVSRLGHWYLIYGYFFVRVVHAIINVGFIWPAAVATATSRWLVRFAAKVFAIAACLVLGFALVLPWFIVYGAASVGANGAAPIGADGAAVVGADDAPPDMLLPFYQLFERSGPSQQYKICISRPPKCVQNATIIGSTRNYAVFRVPAGEDVAVEGSPVSPGTESKEILVVPISKLSSIESRNHGVINWRRDGDAETPVVEEIAAVLSKRTSEGLALTTKVREAVDAVRAVVESEAAADAERGDAMLWALEAGAESGRETAAELREAVAVAAEAAKAVSVSVRGLEAMVETEAAADAERGDAVLSALEATAEATKVVSASVRGLEALVETGTAADAERGDAMLSALEAGTESTLGTAQELRAGIASLAIATEAVSASVHGLEAVVSAEAAADAERGDAMLSALEAGAESDRETAAELREAVAGAAHAMAAVSASVRRLEAMVAAETAADAERTGTLTAALEAGAESGLETASELRAGIDRVAVATEAVSASVQGLEAMVVAETAADAERGAEVSRAQADTSEQIALVAEVVDRIRASLRPFPVTRFVTMDLGLEPTDLGRPEIIYSLAGFGTGRAELSPLQHDWLEGFLIAINGCGDPAPTIRLTGFASAEPYQNGDAHVDGLCDGGADAERQTPQDANAQSDLNNCGLASQRVRNVAAYLSLLSEDGNGDNAEKYDAIKTNTQQQMIASCAAGGADPSVTGLETFSIVPWCTVGEMKNSRFSVSAEEADADAELHFLNRSVHLEIWDAGACGIL